MNMRDSLRDFYRLLTNDETLLRLLWYTTTNPLDDPLSPTKPNILDMNAKDKWKIINSVIFTTSKTDDLKVKPTCRLLFYAGRRNSTGNYMISEQDIIFDVLVHFDYENTDQRCSWICDRINDLVFNQRVAGMGKVQFKNGTQISSPESYVGYRLTYTIGSENW